MGPGDASELSPRSGGKLGLSIPKLKDDGSNWVLYKTKIYSAICGVKGYRKHITGRAKEPAITDADETDTAKLEAHEDALDDWHTNESAIRSILLDSVTERRYARYQL